MKFEVRPPKKNEIQVEFDPKRVLHNVNEEKGVLSLKVKEEKYTRKQFMLLMRECVRIAKAHQIETLCFDFAKITSLLDEKKKNEEELAMLIAENMVMAGYEFSFYKKESSKKTLKKVVFSTEKQKSAVQKGVKKGVLRATHINWCRNLANTPGNDMTPKILAGEVRRVVAKEKNAKLRVKILGEKEMHALKMNGVLAVGQGSKEPSQFIVVEYLGGEKKEAPIVLVGKGVTFDSGGIDTKPHPYALDMMMDMSGGAAVLATALVAAQTGIRKNIVALVPAVENMPSGESFRPGDVIRMMDGTTVEIGHTDAEGRLILADAISYAKKYKPSVVLDVATLTGAASVALGERATAYFTRDEQLAEKIEKASKEAVDPAWRLPLWEEYEAEIVGNVADIANVRTKGRDGVGGAITAATFLQHFAKDIPVYAHFDIAPTMTAAFDEQLAKGAKGSPIRLLSHLLTTL